VERALARVRHVDDDAELVHAPHDLVSPRAETLRHLRSRAVRAGADPVEVVVPHEGQDAQTASEEPVESLEASLEGMAPLDARNGGNAAGGVRLGELPTVAYEPRSIRPAPGEGVDLREHPRRPRGGVGGEAIGLDPAGEDHGAEPCFRSPLEVQVAGTTNPQIVAEVHGAHDRVQVRVEDRPAGDEPLRDGAESRGGGPRHGGTIRRSRGRITLDDVANEGRRPPRGGSKGLPATLST